MHSMIGVFMKYSTPAHPLQGRVKWDKFHKDKLEVNTPKETPIKIWTHQVLWLDHFFLSWKV